MPSDQHLYFRELELNGSSTLAECDIPPGATLFLKVRCASFSSSVPLSLSQVPVVASSTLPLQTDDPISEEGCSFSEPLGTSALIVFSAVLVCFPN